MTAGAPLRRSTEIRGDLTDVSWTQLSVQAVGQEINAGMTVPRLHAPNPRVQNLWS
jgi:hypothetical protein